MTSVQPHGPVLIKAIVVAAAMLAGFVAGYDTALVSAAGAAALLVTRRVAPKKVYAAIDWDLLMLFVGLFVVVGAGERAGFDRRLFDVLAPLGVAHRGWPELRPSPCCRMRSATCRP